MKITEEEFIDEIKEVVTGGEYGQVLRDDSIVLSPKLKEILKMINSLDNTLKRGEDE